MSTHRIAVIILGYNHRKDLPDVLFSVSKQSYKNYFILYVDNASHDDSVEFVRKEYPEVQVKQNSKNLGYAGAYAEILDQVFRTKSCECAVLLNPDTVVENHWLEELVNSAYTDCRIALAQSKIYLWKNGRTNIINTFGNRVHFLGFGYCGHHGEDDSLFFSEDTEVTYPSGASLLIKKYAYEHILGLDRKFFAYLEDQDLGWRAHLFGYRCIVSAKSHAWHKYDFRKKSLNTLKFYLLERNRIYFLLTCYEWKTLIFFLPAFLFMEIGVFFNAIAKGYVKAKIQSYWSVLRNISYILQKRERVQSMRKLRDTDMKLYWSDTIDFSEIQSRTLSLANSILALYYRLTRFFV